MGKSKAKAKRAPPSQEPAVNAFAAKHGDYAEERIVDLAGELGEGRQRTFKAVKNRGGTTVERWLASGSLSRGQAEAIGLYARAWHKARPYFGHEPRVTANWSLVAHIRGMPASEWVHSQLEAKELILHMDAAIFKAMPAKYGEAWKNVVIFDEAAGVAGSRLGYSNRSAEAQAKTVCLFIADMIATLMRLG